MTQITNSKTYDLEKRTYNFALDIRTFVKSLSKSEQYSNDVQQLVRPSGSVGANYIEANEALSKKDFYICGLKYLGKKQKSLFTGSNYSTLFRKIIKNVKNLSTRLHS